MSQPTLDFGDSLPPTRLTALHDYQPTHAELADLVGVERSIITGWTQRGLIPTPLTLRTALRAYCGRLREQAAARLGDSNGKFDLTQERARLAAAQREQVEEKTRILRGEYAPIVELERVLGAAIQAVNDRFDQLPAQLKAACSDLPPAAVDQIMTTIAKARAEWAQTPTTLALETAAPDADEEHEDAAA